ncbi:PAS domain-containing protein [Paenibacillus hemerocallicola]|jgi:PAS domain S-box-containing protein|uniref:histidine kinase n=1 Tax=Paenibacillus hemerocallicola TaxID=1172614 RepID=A0A5C4SXU1_9BACL|nr:ATP-binding protein [Paenibacillus hemerocallicola]TNJ60651.1 PAS domain-containing protein [Paenibacillus hemerocallicola]
MSELRKQYIRALTQYFEDGSSGSQHPASTLGSVLQTIEPEEIVHIHEQSMQRIAASVEPEEALRYYRLSFVFLMELLAHYKYKFQHVDNNEQVLEELRNVLFKTHNSFQSVASKYENVLQHMDSGIVLFDSEGYISFVNVLMGRYLGVPRRSLLGLDLPGLASYSGLSRSFRKLIVKLHREMFLYRLRYHEVIDEHGRHFLVTATYGEELDGDILISVKDVTEFKKIEQSAYQNDKLAMLGKIAAAIAHEIRNPLTSIRGFMQLLRPHLVQLGKEEYARIVIDEIDRANDIIYEFLNSSKPSTPVKKEVHVDSLLKEVKLLFESEAILKGCDIELSPIDPALTICVDVKQAKQALLNIVKNSLDAIGGSTKAQRGMIGISAVKQSSKVMIMVQDNGTGMDYHTQSKLFDPFFTTKLEGTGLGLAVCYRIIKNHGGHIQVDSDIGTGTQFKITLPLC